MKSVDIMSLVRENVKRLKPYSSARDEFQGAASVFLDANENPFNTDFNRYPDPRQLLLKNKIAALKQVNPDQIFIGNGSDEPIDLLIRAFCEPGVDNVLIPQPTYGMYTVSAEINNVAIQTVKLTEEFDLDNDAIINTWNTHTKLLFLCSPNNPSGNILDVSRIADLLSRFHGVVIIDEAYIDFTGYAGFIPLLAEYNNLVVLQTLSKAWGLAGIRLGMCFANPEIIQVLNKIKPPYNISSLTQAVALRHLEGETQKDGWVSDLRQEKEKLKKELLSLSVIRKVFPSDANFLLARVDNAKLVYTKLVAQGIIVRDRSAVVLCEDCLRITVGTAKENQTLVEALKHL